MRTRAIALLLLGCAAVGCGDPRAPQAAPGARVVRDAAGEAVRLPASVRRVVTTVPGQTATLLAMGLGVLLVGVGDAERAEGVVGGLPRVPVWPTIPAEAVAVLEPDLLLVDRTLSAHDLPALRARFPGTFATDSSSLDGLGATFLRLAEAVGHPARGRRLADDLSRARRDARAQGRPRVVLLAQGDPPVALGPGALLDDMVRSVGGENLLADLGRPSAEVAPEVVRVRAPDWILMAGGDLPDALRDRWASVPAIARGRVASVADDAFVQAGPATADALRRLAALLSQVEAPR